MQGHPADLFWGIVKDYYLIDINNLDHKRKADFVAALLTHVIYATVDGGFPEVPYQDRAKLNPNDRATTEPQ